MAWGIIGAGLLALLCGEPALGLLILGFGALVWGVEEDSRTFALNIDDTDK